MRKLAVAVLLETSIQATLAAHPELRRHDHAHPLGNHCYVASEALWHATGAMQSRWQPATVTHEGTVHWFLRLRSDPSVVWDLTVEQFRTPPPYGAAVNRGFLTSVPSRRAQFVLDNALGVR